MASDNQPEVVHLDQNEAGLYELTSLCMSCHSPDGQTRILPIKIPYFRDVLLESFSCDECGFKNNTVKSAGEIQPKGCTYRFRIDNTDDFQRQIVRSDSGIFSVTDLDLEMPRAPGQYTTLESTFSKILTDLSHDQPLRKVQQPEVHDALARIIDRLQSMLEGQSFPIKVVLDDPSGNSFIAPAPGEDSSKYAKTEYTRSHEQNVELGLALDDDDDAGDKDIHNNSTTHTTSHPDTDPLSDLFVNSSADNEIYTLPTTCSACTKPCTINMKKVHIPHFKEVYIIATACDACGYRSSDVKTGGAVPALGKKITLLIKSRTDLSRDILKSESCALHSPDLGLEVQPGTLGGRFTTVEGLLTQVREQLYGQIFDVDSGSVVGSQGEVQQLAAGDSMPAETRGTWAAFFARLDRALQAEMEFSITLVDPLANSFVQKDTDGDEPDPQITVEEYTRSEEEEEELGLKDMKVEGYEQDQDEDEEEENEKKENSN